MKNNPRLKVGLVFDDSLDSNDGVAQYIKTLGSWLADQGHSVCYLVGESKTKNWHGGQVFSLAKNLPVKFNGNKLSIPLPANKSNIKNILARENFDVLHVMMPHSPFMAQKVVNLANRETAVVGTFHIFPANWTARAGGRLLRLSYGRLKRFGRVVAVSTAAQQYARRSFLIKSSVIPNPINISKFSTSEVRPMKNQIVFLGRLVKRKGARELIEAFSLLSSRKPDAKLVIAGDGPQRKQLIAQATKLGLGDRVKFLGYIEEASKARLLASANIACFPSLYGESFGIVLLEAMAAGSGIVLGGDNPGYRSVLAKQPELLIDPTDTQAFAKRLEDLLANDTESKKLHQWQLETIKQYNIEVVGNQVLDMYYDVIAR